MEKDFTTEQKIKEAAKRVFQKKGLGLARTREIAEEAGINLALLNYYFRSKEKIFDIVMEESVKEMFSMMSYLINDESTTLSEKIDGIIERYIIEISKNPHLPLFILTELQANPEWIIQKIGIPKGMIINSCMYKQLKEQILKESLGFNPVHIIVNIISLSVFPILMRPILMNIHHVNEAEFSKFIEERRTLIPLWIKTILQLQP